MLIFSIIKELVRFVLARCAPRTRFQVELRFGYTDLQISSVIQARECIRKTNGLKFFRAAVDLSPQMPAHLWKSHSWMKQVWGLFFPLCLWPDVESIQGRCSSCWHVVFSACFFPLRQKLLSGTVRATQHCREACCVQGKVRDYTSLSSPSRKVHSSQKHKAGSTSAKNSARHILKVSSGFRTTSSLEVSFYLYFFFFSFFKIIIGTLTAFHFRF